MQASALESRPSPLWLRSLYAALWVAAFVVLVLATWAGVVWLENAGLLSALRNRGGAGAAVALVFVHAAVAVSPAPGETVAIANSTIYGFGWGVVMNWTGWMIAAIVEFALLRGAIKSLAVEPGRWTPRWLRRLPADHPLFLIAGRWVPFGGHIVNAAAAARATFRRHLWCAAVSIIPVAVLFSGLANGWRWFW
jgi:uncharacterized membrane protein YdjX (TVP38/TMEM64 family)